MNILIPNSWLKDYLETNATPTQFADAMSLTSVSIERLEKVGDDIVFDIEVTTNRPDLMSIEGIAREASAVLPQQGYKAVFKPRKVSVAIKTTGESPLLKIKNDKTLVNRILAVLAEVELGPSPELISKRLEKTGIRAINNVVDATNYIMREVGHPSHVFDYDRIPNQTLIIRRSKKSEKISTLDEKEYILPGNDIVADDGTGNIIDLLGIMGTSNSVVTPTTKRVVLFLDNNNPNLLRQTSMNLGIRTEAAVLNEKGLDPELMMPTMLRGIELLKENAQAKILSPIIDIYPNKPISKNLKLKTEKINSLIGVEIPTTTIIEILTHLGFGVKSDRGFLNIEVPTIRNNDIEIPEDIIEEVARVYGYHKIPNSLPAFAQQNYYHQEKNEFYWIQKVKDALFHWGLNEVYTYSMVSEELFDGPIERSVKLKNPLTEDRVYLRNSLTPSLIEVVQNNKSREELRLFEIANVYFKKTGLPDEIQHLAVILKHEGVNFYEAKGIVEQILNLLGIKNYNFSKKDDGVEGAVVNVGTKKVGVIEVLGEVTFEIDITELLKHARETKVYKEPAKFPPIIEDLRFEIAPHYTFHEIESEIKKVSDLVYDVALLDVYENKKTFRITFLDRTKNLTNEDVAPIRDTIYNCLSTNFKAISA
jgi:phenylalanyl-tRNA synthetase beta chain